MIRFFGKNVNKQQKTNCKMFKKFAKRSAIYRIQDKAIDNLKIRITFQRVNSLLKLPKYNPEKCSPLRQSNDDIPTTSTAFHNSQNNDRDIEIVEIKWQEKIFSLFEKEFYKDSANCTTEVQRRYHNLLKNERGEVPRKRKSSKSRERKSTESKKSVIFTYVNEDDFIVPEDENFPTNPLRESKVVEVMYIYAALNPDLLLFSLKWYPEEATLHVYPDFRNFQDPYLIEMDTDYRHLFIYSVENISKSQQQQRKSLTNASDDIQNYLELPELRMTSDWRESKELSKKFQMPPKYRRRVVILFEIRDGQGFHLNHIHIRYHVKLPDQMTLEDGKLSASTHTSAKTTTRPQTWHFGHTFQLVVLCSETFCWNQLCRIFFEVISIDSWFRERIEGYAHFSFFLQPGEDEQRLNCVRPIENFIDTLNRYFIGGRKKFDYEKFFNGYAENFLNGFQCKTKYTGHFTIHCRRICQRHPDILRPPSGKPIGMTLDDIMRAYREARQRLEAMAL